MQATWYLLRAQDCLDMTKGEATWIQLELLGLAERLLDLAEDIANDEMPQNMRRFAQVH